ncbi:uncharacterized protein EI90DRAFT_3041680 [Cantharellus anzutake]|uniref:uncharacterized protein n=1 Tax=Cantharellus anzutake TaxID=1750568 RepID=UPI001902DE02|nr:uncharacterized protein EI90DRAFT_3041680 [Cantharellus anzutake]KAF8338112.1 hypothetical protein EI90DRAFT_3041680 [Cantharellus anzutake]
MDPGSAPARRSRKKPLFAAPTESSRTDSSTPQSSRIATPRPSRLSVANGTPTGSRFRHSEIQTPPSITETAPFDWEAARSYAPPPYGMPGRTTRSSRLSVAGNEPSPSSSSQKKDRIVRKAGFFERVSAFPARIAFEISMFPYNVPLPRPTTSGSAIGGLLHFIHILVKWYGRSRAVVREEDPLDLWKSEVDWNFDEEKVPKGWSWVTPFSLLLFLISFANVLYLFTRFRTYHLHLRPELAPSTHASLVSKDFLSPPTPTSVPQKIMRLIVQSLTIAWRLAVGTSPAPEDLIPLDLQPNSNKVQQLDVWFPGDFELALFIIYSPAHWFAWKIFSTANWFWSLALMGLLSLQVYALISAYKALIKDKEILSAEVLHEYDSKFVTPRLHRVMHDKCVMTHEAEFVDSPFRRSYR